MPYPEMMVAPMREDLVRVGFREMRTPEEVDEVLSNANGSVLLAINSVCGCAAGAMRPAVALSLQGEHRPDHLTTVFAGQDLPATDRARGFIPGYPASSPSIAILKDGDVVFMLERHQIEGRTAFEIADDLKSAYAAHCVS